MTFRMAAAATLALLLALATDRPGHTAQSDKSRLDRKCTMQQRQCNSRCNKVYESKRALVACRDRCEDAFYGCKGQFN